MWLAHTHMRSVAITILRYDSNCKNFMFVKLSHPTVLSFPTQFIHFIYAKIFFGIQLRTQKG